MRRSSAFVLALGLASLSCGARPAIAVDIDGKLDPDYGSALSTQTTQTDIGDNTQGQVDYSLGSELDGGYATISNGVLYLFLSGNLAFSWTLEGQTRWLPVNLFLDSKPGGQNRLRGDNAALDPINDLNHLAGLTFDTGFEPDYWLSLGGGPDTWPRIKAFYAELLSTGGGAGSYLGITSCGGPGTLSGGTNPFGILATIDESNVAGVTAGCGPASGGGVTRGVEWAIPLSAIGNPTGCITVSAFVSSADLSGILNQVLGPLPPGTCNPGPAATVNFDGFAGNQYFTVCPSAVPVQGATWGRVKTIRH